MERTRAYRVLHGTAAQAPRGAVICHLEADAEKAKAVTPPAWGALVDTGASSLPTSVCANSSVPREREGEFEVVTESLPFQLAGALSG